LEAQVSAAEADLRAAKDAASTLQAAATSRSMVRASIDGVIQQRFREVGDMVTPESPILTVLDLQKLEVTASVPFADAVRINTGNAARLLAAPEGTPLSGLRVVSRPESIPGRTTPVPIRLGFESPPAIPVGTAVQVAIDAEKRDRAVLVPIAAIGQENDETAVFVVMNGRVERRAVSVGITDGEHVEITAGIHAGEAVVIESEAALFAGARVAAADVTR
jgi:RND family efflux transporter MFP subunit